MVTDTPLTEYEHQLARAWADRTKPPGEPVLLVGAVLEIFDITRDELFSQSRRERLVDARSVIAHILCRRGWTWTQIGLLMGRSSSAVGHLLERIKEDPDLKSLAQEMVA